MRFISIPRNGQSWRSPIVYTFATELDEPADVDIEIFDIDAEQMIARKRLYSVTEGVIDIAPILRSVADMRINSDGSTAIQRSPGVAKISVGIMGLMSESRLFFAEEVGWSKARVLSRMPEPQSVEYGESIMFSVVAPELLTVEIIAYSPTSQKRHAIRSNSLMALYDIVINTGDFMSDVQSIELRVISGGSLVKTLNISVGRGAAKGRRLYWRNRLGGIESYLFPKSVRLVDEAVVDGFTTSAKRVSKLKSTRVCSRLCSALECGEELQRISEIIYAPYTYEMTSKGISDVELVTRCLEHSSHGELRIVAIEVCSEWKGGEI